MNEASKLHQPGDEFLAIIANRVTDEEHQAYEAKKKADEFEAARKRAEDQRLSAWRNLEWFYEKNKQLPQSARDTSIEKLKDENLEFYKMLENWDPILDPFGFCICGPVGTGKTFALTAILNLVTTSLADFGYSISASVTWSTSSILLEELKDSYNAETSVLEKIQKLQNIRYLFIDDFGAHKASDFAIEKIINVLDYRVNNNLPTFFSTNCKVDQLKSSLGERIFSRVIATSVMVEIKGKDRRLDIHAERLKKLKEGAK